jgi:lipoyl(octanoyl) transferase
VSTVICRLLPFGIADGPHNMAADEALLESAAAGAAALRFYGWTEATLSLGYFQPERVRREDARLAGLPWVRRPSGGGAIIHHLEITYALALPPGPPWQTGASWLCRMHSIIAAALGRLGVRATSHCPVPGEPPFVGFLCFLHFTAGDLMIGTAKIAGSAQRRQGRALLQHGSLLLAASPQAPLLPGIRELTGRTLDLRETLSVLETEFAAQTGWTIEHADWTETGRQRAAELAATKYGRDWWNRKR